ncbi:MAG: winged helix-turn-helix domain-containing protein [Candidatus Thorarchaeota archaeon]
MEIKTAKTFEEVISHPTTANFFLFLKNSEEPVGVREVQRALNINSSSTAHWHLSKLADNGIIEQLSDNKYQMLDNFKGLKRIPMTVTLDHYVVGRKIIPEIAIVIAFLGTISVSIIFLIIIGSWIEAAIIGFLSSIVTLFILIRFLRHFHFRSKL